MVKYSKNKTDNILSVMDNYFRCLLKHRILHYAPNKASRIINSFVVLHNLCIMDKVPLYDEDIVTEELDLDDGVFQQNNIDTNERGSSELIKTVTTTVFSL
jgi:hypothetical protein